jgi:riboflavin biosynthesis pyrimidine reductase
MVMSLDGEIASKTNESSFQRLKIGLTNSEDQDLVRREIEASEAVIIGANSVRAEGNLPEIKNFQGKYPTWCIYTNNGLEFPRAFWDQKKIPRIMVSQNALKSVHSEVESLSYGGLPPARFLMRELQGRGFKKILLLGGGQVNSLFYSEACVDELKLTIAPILLGKNLSCLSASLDQAVHFELLSSEAKGSFLFLHYKVTRKKNAVS